MSFGYMETVNKNNKRFNILIMQVVTRPYFHRDSFVFSRLMQETVFSGFYCTFGSMVACMISKQFKKSNAVYRNQTQ